MIDIHEYVDQAFKEDGAISQVLNGYRLIPIQVDYAHAVADTLVYSSKSTSVSMLEAETGTGKSFGYLVPLSWSAAQGKQVAVSTYSNHLLKQILNETFPVVRDVCDELLGVKLNAAPRLGLNNFVVPSKVENYISDNHPDHNDLKQAVSNWLSNGGQYIDELVKIFSLQDIDLDIKSVQCKYSDSDTDLEVYTKHLDVADNANIIFTNHSLTMLHIAGRKVFNHERLSDLIIDEADELPNAASSIISNSSSLNDLISLIDHGRKFTPDSNVDKYFGKTRDVCTDIWDNLQSLRVTDKQILPITKDMKDYLSLADELHNTIDKLIKYLNKKKILPVFEDEWLHELERHRTVLSHLTMNNWGSYAMPAVSWSAEYSYPSFKIIPLDPGMAFSRYSENYQDRKPLNAIVLTSATLGDGREKDLQRIYRDYGFFNNSLIVHSKHFEPEYFGKVEFVLADKHLPKPSDMDSGLSSSKEWLDNTAQMIRLAADSGQRVFALTLSSNDTIDLTSRLSDIPHLFHQQNGQKLSSLMQSFTLHEDSVLISHGAWTGVDLPGLIDNLVITRLPFSPPDTPENSIRREWLLRKGYSNKSVDKLMYFLSLGAARKKFRQGFGRAIRRANDFSTIWIADPRFLLLNEFQTVLPERFTVSKGLSISALDKAKLWTRDGVINKSSKSQQSDWVQNSW